MELSKDHVTSVCRMGEGEKCCAFLSGTPRAFRCAKEMPEIMGYILERLREGTMGAKGDNCSGPPDFRPS